MILRLLAQQQNGDYIYHYSVMDGMRNGIYEGQHDVAHLAKKGDFGLGTYNLLDGEMIVKDGIFFRIRTDGNIEKADATSQSPFNSLTNFNADTTVSFGFSGNLNELQKYIVSLLPSKNLPYAVQVELTLKTITAGGAFTDKKGNHYFTNLQQNAITRLSADGENSILVKATEKLLWPDNVYIADDGYAYISANQLNSTPAFTGGKDEGKAPFYIYKFKL